MDVLYAIYDCALGISPVTSFSGVRTWTKRSKHSNMSSASPVPVARAEPTRWDQGSSLCHSHAQHQRCTRALAISHSHDTRAYEFTSLGIKREHLFPVLQAAIRCARACTCCTTCSHSSVCPEPTCVYRPGWYLSASLLHLIISHVAYEGTCKLTCWRTTYRAVDVPDAGTQLRPWHC